MDAAGAHHRRLAAGVAHRAANGGGRHGVPPERPALVGNRLRHALVAARAGIRVNRVADAGLLGVVELAAARSEMKSAPAWANAPPKNTASSAVLPPAMHSSARKRMPTAKFLLTARRASASTSSGSRTRLFSVPP